MSVAFEPTATKPCGHAKNPDYLVGIASDHFAGLCTRCDRETTCPYVNRDKAVKS